MNLPIILMLWLCVLFCINCNAQKELEINSLQIRIGSSTLLGDLGGSKGKGTNFVQDFDLKSTRFCLGVSSDWKKSSYIDYRLSLNYVHLSAADSYSEELSRRSRNLSVKTDVIEIIPSLKFNFFGNSRQNRSNKIRNDFTTLYLTAGLGFIYFSPLVTKK